MTTKVAINGFGRIGRLALRLIQEREDLEVVAINDLTDSAFLAHLLKYDTAQGKFDGTIEVKDGAFVINGKEIKTYAEMDAKNLPWADLGVDIVLECTGVYRTVEKAQAHIEAGAKKVVISAPGKGDIKSIVYNVNHDVLDGSETVIDGASCTTNALAQMVKVLNDKFGIHHGIMTTVHAYTADQNTQDGPHRGGDYRRARAAAENIVPNTTGAAKAIGKVIPEMKGKLDGAALRVPVVTGSIVELYSILNKNVTVEEVDQAFKEAANESLGYNEDQIVSSDIVGMTYAGLYDATVTKVMDVDGQQLVKTTAWYDNEMSYTAQLVRTLDYFANLK